MRAYIHVMLTLAVLISAGCARQSAEQEICGTYIGSYAGVEEWLHLRTGGQYTQSVTRNGTVLYENSGSWKCASEGDLTLTNFIVAVDLSEAQLIKDKDKLPYSPQKYSYMMLSDNGGNPRTLIGATKTFYYFQKQPNVSAN